MIWWLERLNSAWWEGTKLHCNQQNSVMLSPANYANRFACSVDFIEVTSLYKHTELLYISSSLLSCFPYGLLCQLFPSTSKYSSLTQSWKSVEYKLICSQWMLHQKCKFVFFSDKDFESLYSIVTCSDFTVLEFHWCIPSPVDSNTLLI